MPNRKKKTQRSRTAPLFVLAIVIVAGIWATEQIATLGFGPSWLKMLFSPQDPTGGRRIGLIAGHAGNDTGAICADGLTEAEINRDVAERVTRGLARRGIRAEILEEFDDRLDGYRATALVSVHADSCQVDLSGFKVASPDGGSAASEQLAACLWDRYEAATGLPRHPSTVTKDMTEYHAFRKVSSQTPAAIIELGFLQADRTLLTEEPGRAAQGIVDAILCFLTPAAPAQSTPAS